MLMRQYKVTELLDSGVLVIEAGLFLLKNSHRVSCFQTLTPHNLHATSYVWVSFPLCRRENRGPGMWNHMPFLSCSHYLPPCQDTGLTLDSSINLA